MPTVAIDRSDALDPVLRGWGRYTRELTRALRELRPPDLALRFLERGRHGPELLWEQVALPRTLRRERAAAVHAPNCFLPLRRPCPGIVTFHDLAFEAYPEDFPRRTRWKYRAIAPRAARSAERVICVSAFTRDDLCARYGTDPGKIRVIPLAPALAEGDAEPPEGLYLLAVGDLRQKKNLVRLVEAFKRLHDEGVPHRLVLAGLDAGEGPRVREAAAGAPVELRGYVTDDGLDALMRGADLVVHPSVYEGFGLVLVEAMARGCPVVAARTTALPETGGEAAEYFDPLDPDDIAAAIRRVLEDSELRERLIEAGRGRAASLSWEQTAERTADVYREVVG
jgi:glycosyltransferase involved in cell wall biosynthesis